MLEDVNNFMRFYAFYCELLPKVLLYSWKMYDKYQVMKIIAKQHITGK